MPLSKNLRRERSQAISLQTVTFNAPGVYYPPYGKSVFELSGRGTPGNATIPGNADGGTNSTLYYYYQPASSGNVAQYFPATGGNYAGVVTTPGNYLISYITILSYPNPDGTVNPVIPSRDLYNPSVSTPYYNPYVPAYSNYNPPEPASTPAAYNAGNPNYNPTTPGTAGANYAVLGVPLPGGAIGSAAPVVGYSAVQVSYATAGVPISVPPGGYVVIRNKLPNT